jgi:hypothetical protein
MEQGRELMTSAETKPVLWRIIVWTTTDKHDRHFVTDRHPEGNRVGTAIVPATAEDAENDDDLARSFGLLSEGAHANADQLPVAHIDPKYIGRFLTDTEIAEVQTYLDRSYNFGLAEKGED